MHAIEKIYREERERKEREKEGESGLQPNRKERRRRGFNMNKLGMLNLFKSMELFKENTLKKIQFENHTL